MSFPQLSTINETGKKAALLSTIEITLGSLFHSLHIPFSGDLLSINQGLILTRTTLLLGDAKSASIVSSTAAILKSLSPAGKKLTPMLAIAVQGQLFSLGVLGFGPNLFGSLIGMTLLCLWGPFQKMLVGYLIFGSDGVNATETLINEFQKHVSFMPASLFELITLWIGVKVILGLSAVVIATKLGKHTDRALENWSKIQTPAFEQKREHSGQSPFIMALRDLLSPLYLFSLAATLVFLIATREKDLSLLFSVLRPIAFAYLLFLCVRVFPVESVVEKLQGRHPELSQSLSIALKKIKGAQIK